MKIKKIEDVDELTVLLATIEQLKSKLSWEGSKKRIAIDVLEGVIEKLEEENDRLEVALAEANLKLIKLDLL